MRDSEDKLKLTAYNLHHYLLQTLITPVFNHTLTEKDLMSLRRLIESVLELWLDLRCQRGYYDFDGVVQTNEIFCTNSMHDFKNVVDPDDLHDDKYAYVTAIVAKGIVKREHEDSLGIITRISPARVYLAIGSMGSSSLI